MTDWTDAELGALLTEAFAAREGDADPAAARHIARAATVRQHRWPTMLVAAAAVVAAVAGTTYLVGSTDSQRPVAPAPSLPTESDASNRAAAEKEATRMMSLMPVPPGAERLPGQPGDWPDASGKASISIGPVVATQWYQIDETAAYVRGFVEARTPTGTELSGNVTAPVGGVNFTNYYMLESTNSRAYTSPDMLIQWSEVNDRTVIRVDVAIEARPARHADTLVPSGVTAIEIRRYRGRLLPATELTSPDDDPTIQRVVADFNSLGASTDPGPRGCPMGDRPTDLITFTWPGGELTAQVIQGCTPRLDLTRNGAALGQTLSTAWFAALGFSASGADS